MYRKTMFVFSDWYYSCVRWSMPRSGCSALHGVNPNFKKNLCAYTFCFHCLKLRVPRVPLKLLRIFLSDTNWVYVPPIWCSFFIFLSKKTLASKRSNHRELLQEKDSLKFEAKSLKKPMKEKEEFLHRYF